MAWLGCKREKQSIKVEQSELEQVGKVIDETKYYNSR